MPVSDDLLEKKREERPVPVQESTPGSFAHDLLPAADHLKFMVPVLDLDKFTLTKDIRVDQVEAVRDHGLSKSIVSALVTLDDVNHQLHHIFLDRLLLLSKGVHLLHASLNLPHDELTSVAVDQDHPLVDQEFLGLELDLDSFQHLDCLNYDWEGCFGHRHVVLLEEQQVHLEGALDLGGQLDTSGDLVSADLQEVLVAQHRGGVFQAIRVHESDPLNEPHVVLLHLDREQGSFVRQLLLQESINVGRVDLRLLLGERHFRQELARIHLQVVVQDDQRALLLESPDLREELGVLDLKKLLVHRVIRQQRHVLGRCFSDSGRT